ncbi:isochorismatase family protein [Sporolactobacillus shoreicorticis]|uniref:Isochorismatase family protein n=1 Tax=Sporolactobacillus shoreicorticis TaxID=1923877 RepID=A0ABW5S3E7_9BACL|nr:isochorismatase family protein [Sporolactobacillus shoreicorticis]MCO7125813.1 isochorismatase family protein [Sporolactobacillus shoreicorticis]
MRALLVIDVQQGFVDSGNFDKVIDRIEFLIKQFKNNEEPIFFIRHKEDNPQSLIQDGTPGSKIYGRLASYVTAPIEKCLPSAFYHTDLKEKLQQAGVDEVVLCGFNAEYCIFFNSAAAFEHGFKVRVIEDACASVNTGRTYEMNDLDIPEFICTVLYDSGEVMVNELQEFLDEQNAEHN